MKRQRLITQSQGMRLLRETNGRIFFAKFVKKDGSLRRMTARVGVSKGVTGDGMKWDPEARGMCVVFDMDKAAFRIINTGTLLEVRAAGEVYNVIPSADAQLLIGVA